MTSKFVYENKYFEVVIGFPVATHDIPQPRIAYLVLNKETGVEEYWHHVLFVVKDWVDSLTKLMDGEDPDAKTEVPVQKGLFN